MKQKTAELTQLSLFRGIAALYVLIGHCAYITETSLKPIPGPGHAVDFFMLMSGFLMALHFHERKTSEPWNKRSTIFRFYTRRFFRIAPVYYLFYIIVTLFAADFYAMSLMRNSGPVAADPDLITSTGETVLTVFLHTTFLFGAFPGFVEDNILPDWSIGLEMQFYFVFPFLMILMKKIGRIIPVIVCTIIYLFSEHLFGRYTEPGKLLHYTQPSFLPLKINVFLLGIFLGEARHYVTSNNQSKAIQLLLFTFVLCFIGNDFIIISICLYFLLWIFSMTKFSPATLSSFFNRIEGACNNKFVTLFANTSYSVYLLHMIVLFSVNALFVSEGWYNGMGPFTRFGFLFGVCVPIIYFISYWVYVFLEYPAINYGKKMLSKMYQRSKK